MVNICATSVFLIQINKAIAYMPVELYTQWASKDGGRFYVSRGAAGHISISENNCTILAQQIQYFVNKPINDGNI